MSGTEADTAADLSGMEGQSAAEEMNLRARDTDLKVDWAVSCANLSGVKCIKGSILSWFAVGRVKTAHSTMIFLEYLVLS